MISAILVDDEVEASKGLSSMIKIFCPEINILGQSTSIKEATSLIETLHPQLLFLDVEMTDGTGFDILENVCQLNFAVIFVTAFDHYAIRALRMHALDYLLKPVDPDELVKAVQNAGEIIKSHSYPEYGHAINDHKTQDFTKIGIPTASGIQYIQLNDIIRLESSNNYTFIYTTNSKPLLISKTIKSFETTLPGHMFIRCHQRHIINLRHVVKLTKSAKGSFITLQDGAVPVSRSYKPVVLSELKKLHKTM